MAALRRFLAMRADTGADTTLTSLPDDALQLVIVACSNTVRPFTAYGVPHFMAVKGLACSEALLRQLHRLQPLVGVRRLAAVQRAAPLPPPLSCPWRFVLLYEDRLSVHLSGVQLKGTWAATFGEAAVCSLVTQLSPLCYAVITPPRCSMSNSKELKKIGAEWKALGEEAPLATQPLTLTSTLTLSPTLPPTPILAPTPTPTLTRTLTRTLTLTRRSSRGWSSTGPPRTGTRRSAPAWSRCPSQGEPPGAQPLPRVLELAAAGATEGSD